jgi:hypothetical protein
LEQVPEPQTAAPAEPMVALDRNAAIAAQVPRPSTVHPKSRACLGDAGWRRLGTRKPLGGSVANSTSIRVLRFATLTNLVGWNSHLQLNIVARDW